MTNRELLFIIKARNATKGAMNSFRDQLRATGKAAGAAQKQVRGLSQSSRMLAGSVRQATVAVRQFANVRIGGKITAGLASMRAGFASTVKEALNLRSLLIGFSAIFIGRAIVGTLIDFGDEMAKVRAISGATKEEFILLEDAARNLGATTRFSATEAAQGLTFLSRAGFTAAESVFAIAPALNLAQAGALELGRSADILSNIMSAFSIEAERAAGVADVLALTANSSNTSVEQLGNAMKFVGPIARAVGFDINEVSAAIGAMGDSGLQGTLAGTGLRISIQKLLNPVNKAKEALKNLNISMSEVDPTGNSLIDILERLKQAQIEVGDAAFARNVTQIFSARGSTAILALTNQIEKVRELNVATRDAAGVAKETADIMDNTLGGALKGLVSALNEVVIGLGKAFAGPVLQGIIQGLTDITRAIGVLIKQFGLAEDSAEGLAQAFSLLTKAAIIFGATLLGGPIVGAIVLVISTFEDWKGVMVTVGDTAVTLEDIVTDVFERIRATISLIGLPLVGIVISLKRAISGDLKGAADILTLTWKTMREEADIAFNGVAAAANRLSHEFEDDFGPGGNVSTDFKNTSDNIKNAATVTREELDELSDSLKALRDAFAPGLSIQKRFADQENEIAALLKLTGAELKSIGTSRAELLKIQTGFIKAREDEINFIRAGNRALAEEAKLIGLVGVAREIAQARLDATREVTRRDPTGVTVVDEAQLAARAAQLRSNAQDKFRAEVTKSNATLMIEAELIGRSAEEVARIKVALERMKAAKEAGFDPVAVQEFGREAVLAFDKVKEAQREFEQDAVRGSQRAFDKYINETKNFARQYETIVTSAIKSTEDALGDFVTGGKLDFRSLITSIADDLARLGVKQALGSGLEALGLGSTPTSAGGIAGLAGGLLGGGGGPEANIRAGGNNIAQALNEVALQIRGQGLTAGALLNQSAIDAAQEFDQTLFEMNDDFGTVAKEAANNFGDIFSDLGSTIQSFASSIFGGGGGQNGGGIVGSIAGLFSGGGGGGFEGFGGFADFAFAKGGIGSARGAVKLRKFADGGIATQPTLAVFGEGDRPEAFVPLPDGRRIPVEMSGAPAQRPLNVTVNQTITTPNPAQFGRNQDQIARKGALAFSRAMARDN